MGDVIHAWFDTVGLVVFFWTTQLSLIDRSVAGGGSAKKDRSLSESYFWQHWNSPSTNRNLCHVTNISQSLPQREISVTNKENGCLLLSLALFSLSPCVFVCHLRQSLRDKKNFVTFYFRNTSLWTWRKNIFTLSLWTQHLRPLCVIDVRM